MWISKLNLNWNIQYVPDKLSSSAHTSDNNTFKPPVYILCIHYSKWISTVILLSPGISSSWIIFSQILTPNSDLCCIGCYLGKISHLHQDLWDTFCGNHGNVSLLVGKCLFSETLSMQHIVEPPGLLCIPALWRGSSQRKCIRIFHQGRWIRLPCPGHSRDPPRNNNLPHWSLPHQSSV